MMDARTKRQQLEAAGWKFQRRNSKRRWVKAPNSRTLDRCIEYSWAQHAKDTDHADA